MPNVKIKKAPGIRRLLILGYISRFLYLPSDQESDACRLPSRYVHVILR